ncbi:DUF4870 domain-containing protein [Maribacter polysiphoniae]|uniref:DUF4870 domain-containing protein n=1 Tax=Maribacter polysiphoniae TaxID=429344 RepID=A0A316E2C4_9FLAO|nr:DUF4870 domain-containing protein [Maribacter polysiphoniae]MBD1261067.1 DUF4870 domain-containing protein [Maribacter polysiphoniae]PWK23692.1 hypothetical protein LX92_02259 [Maribacter polysiphoniae]
MTDTITKHERNLSAIIHASTFSKFFIPFGNFIIPLVLWTANKKEYEFVDYNGKQALNFQISMLLYSIILGMVSIPFFIGFLPNLFDHGFFGFDGLNSYNNFNIDIDLDGFPFNKWIFPIGIASLLHGALFIVNVVYTILATMRTNEGQTFQYPFTIKFIK